MLDPVLEKRLLDEIEEWGSIRECARVLGFSRQYLTQVLREKTPASEGLLAALGLERRIHRIPKTRKKQARGANAQV